MLARSFVLLTFLLLSSVCCQHKLNLQKEIKIKNSSPNICFLTFRISKDSMSNTNKIELLNQIITEGSFKPEIQEFSNWNSKLQFELIDQNHSIMSVFIEHPLYKNIEYIDEHDQFKSKQLELNTAEFFIRLQWIGQNATLKISEYHNQSSKKLLSTIKLSL